jgi:hypothetical protein
MPGWDEASVDELLADPIVRDLMAADGVEPVALRALLYKVQRTIERYAEGRGGPTSLAGFAQLHTSTRSAPSADRGQATISSAIDSWAKRGRADGRKTRIALADYSRSSMTSLGPLFCNDTRCTARS